jgi:hypothetical protein
VKKMRCEYETSVVSIKNKLNALEKYILWELRKILLTRWERLEEIIKICKDYKITLLHKSLVWYLFKEIKIGNVFKDMAYARKRTGQGTSISRLRFKNTVMTVLQ